jgi:carboxypeptidase Taq
MSAAHQLFDRYRDIAALRAANGLLNWDRQVLMPPKGAAARTEHVARITMMEHSLWVADETQALLDKAQAETDPKTVDGAKLRVLRREHTLRSALPAEMVERRSRLSSDGYEAWKRAKAASDFKVLAPFLRELFAIAAETSKLRNPNAIHPYDPLIDQFDEGQTHSNADRLLSAIKQPIVDLLADIRANGKPIDDSALKNVKDQGSLKRFAEAAAARIGFDFNRGRLDLCANAFCGGSTRFDVRMTTRPSDHVKGVISSSLHEMGHGLYQQGDNPDWTGTPLSGGASLAIHESQSRLWENIVGRSRPFWNYFYPRLLAEAPFLSGIQEDVFWRGMNKVEPTFIRVGADELSYNLHIIIRFELESELITGQLAVNDLPEVWNEKYQRYLGITPPSDALGCLQDVHWSRGSVGYFPTYALGNIIGGAVWQALTSEISDTDAQMERGEFAAILGWLSERIYSKGQRFTPSELLGKLLPKPADGSEWLAYATTKYRDLYGLVR